MTVPTTPIYGLPHEQGVTVPGRTLTGGPSGEDPILAEAVEDELERVDAAVADVQDAVSRGWVPIASGEETGSFTIDLTAGGRYPPGTFSIIEIFYRGSLSTETGLQNRVNGDNTPNLHRRGWTVQATSSTNFVENEANDGTAWRIARWSTATANTAHVRIFETNRLSILSMQATATRVATGTTLRHRTEAQGDLNESRLLDSIQVFTVVGSITAMTWHAVGYRAP